jgi:hypothetical protein
MMSRDQNSKNRRMMIGIGIPISQSKPPFNIENLLVFHPTAQPSAAGDRSNRSGLLRARRTSETHSERRLV